MTLFHVANFTPCFREFRLKYLRSCEAFEKGSACGPLLTWTMSTRTCLSCCLRLESRTIWLFNPSQSPSSRKSLTMATATLQHHPQVRVSEVDFMFETSSGSNVGNLLSSSNSILCQTRRLLNLSPRTHTNIYTHFMICSLKARATQIKFRAFGISNFSTKA
jgi:hypothetical protein